MLSQDHTGHDLPYVDESSRLFNRLVWMILASSLAQMVTQYVHISTDEISQGSGET